ncbi:hypothetical protein NPIL_638911 [Nephila pilipes]|uniref:Uncharacterized protein n=1 Tax=Nephila pilipes TaxID=299642 RepID=A0A8X6NF51_NEPPI|nr:hypothetical protein NPIL_638911 [Nephila pilipes]
MVAYLVDKVKDAMHRDNDLSIDRQQLSVNGVKNGVNIQRYLYSDYEFEEKTSLSINLIDDQFSSVVAEAVGFKVLKLEYRKSSSYPHFFPPSTADVAEEKVLRERDSPHPLNC